MKPHVSGVKYKPKNYWYIYEMESHDQEKRGSTSDSSFSIYKGGVTQSYSSYRNHDTADSPYVSFRQTEFKKYSRQSAEERDGQRILNDQSKARYCATPYNFPLPSLKCRNNPSEPRKGNTDLYPD
jgi:hypothetical protein